jgi:hypothetical protein
MYQETKNEQERGYVNPNSMTEPSCVQTPEFKKLFDCLNNAVSHTTDLSNELYMYGNTIKPIHEPDNMNKQLDNIPTGIIETLFEEVFRLQKANASLVVLANHLRETIGR